MGTLRLSMCAVTLLTVISGFAGSPRSISYSFDYAAVGLGGGISTSTDYELVGLTNDNGSANPAVSQSYQIEPAVGAPNALNAAVQNWSLYE